MARTRDIVIGVIIGGSFLVFFLIMAISFVFSRFGDADGFSGLGSKVAIVNLDGVIASSTDIVRQFDRWGKDSHVRAIVLHINSPGGGVAPSQEIYDKIMKVRAETSKPIVVSMASVCASGGYYIACAADRIVAVPGTVTGSIGVILEWPVVNHLLDKVGIQYETIKSADNKDIGSPFREPTDSDKAMFQSVVDDTYDQFVSVVANGAGCRAIRPKLWLPGQSSPAGRPRTWGWLIRSGLSMMPSIWQGRCRDWKESQPHQGDSAANSVDL